jgi:SAM-dependent methyltransferase
MNWSGRDPLSAETAEGRVVSSAEGVFQQGDLYDDVFRAAGKNYQSEADEVVRLVHERAPGSENLLDVGCGTGSHLYYLRNSFVQVEGVDAAEGMVMRARYKLADVPVHVGDMRTFELNRRFAVVTCLFSSIAYLPAVDIAVAVARLAAHLLPGGVLIIEPWFFPENSIDDYVFWDVDEVDGHTTVRVSRAARDGESHRIEAHYLVAQPGSSTRHFADRHVLAVVDREVYTDAFLASGLVVEYVRPGRPGLYELGLFIGMRPPAPGVTA